MQTLMWKVRIFALWICLAIGMVGVGVARLWAAGVIEDIVAGDEADGGMAAVFLVVFLAVAFSTLVLPDGANRWVNGVLGVLSAFVWFMNTAEFFDDGVLGAEDVVGVVAVLVSLLIVWHAWKWPKAHARTGSEEQAPM